MVRAAKTFSILNSGSVSPAGERICKTKHVFLLPAAKRIAFPRRDGEALPSTLRCTQGICHWLWARPGAFCCCFGAGGRGEEEEEESRRSGHHLHGAGEQQFQGLNGERGEKQAKCSNKCRGAERGQEPNAKVQGVAPPARWILCCASLGWAGERGEGPKRAKTPPKFPFAGKGLGAKVLIIIFRAAQLRNRSCFIVICGFSWKTLPTFNFGMTKLGISLFLR